MSTPCKSCACAQQAPRENNKKGGNGLLCPNWWELCPCLGMGTVMSFRALRACIMSFMGGRSAVMSFQRGLAAIMSFRATWARVLSIKGGRATSLPCSRELVAIMSFCLNNDIQRWLVHLNVSPTRSRCDTVRLWDL